MLDLIQTKCNFKELPSDYEGFRMGGEWLSLQILPEFKIIVLRESNNMSKISPPKAYRPLILEKMHESGRKYDSIYLKTWLIYTWPNIRKDISSHIKSCARCLELQPMDWISMDLA